jgi:ribonuclease P protein component
MGKEHRLTNTKDFATVRSRGRSWSDGLLVLGARRNSLDVSRVGFSIGKRNGNAVIRNRLKRRLREAVRRIPLREGFDIVLVARRGAASADFDGLCRSVEKLSERARITNITQERSSHEPTR